MQKSLTSAIFHSLPLPYAPMSKRCDATKSSMHAVKEKAEDVVFIKRRTAPSSDTPLLSMWFPSYNFDPTNPDLFATMRPKKSQPRDDNRADGQQLRLHLYHPDRSAMRSRLENSSCDFDAHGAGGALDALPADSTEIAFSPGIFCSGDLQNLGLCLLCLPCPCWGSGALGQVRGLGEQYGCRRRFGDKGEGAVDVNRDHHGDDQARHSFSPARELLQEPYDVDRAWPSAGPTGGQGSPYPLRFAALPGSVLF